MSKFNLVYEDVVNDTTQAFEQQFPETANCIVERVSKAITAASANGEFYVEIPLHGVNAHEAAYIAILISRAGFHRVYSKSDEGTSVIRVYWLEI